MDDISQLVDSARAYRIQETPYFKRLRMREESDLRHLREAQEIVQQSAKDFLELQLRRIRLNKLYNDIHSNIEKTSDGKTKGQQQRIQKVFSTFDDIRRSRISMARRRGNEYSRQNRSHYEILPKDDTKLLNKKYDNVFIKRKMYGQQVSKFNLRKLQKYNRLYPNTIHDDIIHHVKRTKKDDYGTYYTLRNRLNYKDTLGEYDDEYTDLLMKCVSFEKEHLDVCGFLEEKLKSNYGDINKIISKVTNKPENGSNIPKLLENGMSSTISTDLSKQDDDEETELDSISLQTDVSNKIELEHQNIENNNNNNDNNENYQTVTRIDNTNNNNNNINNDNNEYLQDISNNNSELFTSETVLHTNRYLNSVEEENELDDDISYNDNNDDNNCNNNNINITTPNDIVLMDDSETGIDNSIPTSYQSQPTIHNNIQLTTLKQTIFQSDLNIDLNTNLDDESETNRNLLTKSSVLDENESVYTDELTEEFNENIIDNIKNTENNINNSNDDINNNNNNNYTDDDFDNTSEKSRQFEEDLEALRYTEDDVQNISSYVIKNNYILEDVISDMIENSRIDDTPLNFYKLLSNIYLAYGMNLIKSSIDEEHIDLNVIKTAAEKQNASMSHALHVIFSSR